MKIPVIKKLVESYSYEQLRQAESALAEEQNPTIQIEGEDSGEQLTHAYAALWIKQKVEEGVDFKMAMRQYTQRIRSSIN